MNIKIIILLYFIFRIFNFEECLICDSGKYLLNCNTCIECPIGYYCGSGIVNPKPCPKLTYNDKVEQTDISSCKNCEEGFYVEGIGNGFCKECPVGFYCTGGKRYDCSEGTYTDQTGLTECLTCPSGHYCPEGSENPIICPIGTYSNEGKSRCTPCEEGTYNIQSGTNNCQGCNNGFRCQNLIFNGIEECEKGTYSLVNSSECITCEDGKFSLITGSDQCIDCLDGHSCIKKDQPIKCPIGTYSKGNYTCITCDEGYYNDKEGSDSCKICPKGSKCPTPYEKPVLCDEGFYSDEGQTSCTICPAGYSCLNPSEDIVICKKGTFSFKGKTRCEECPYGYYTDELGSDSCEQCPLGFECVTPSSTPVECSDGEYSAELSTICQKCPQGTFSDVNKGKCISCKPGRKCPDPTVINGILCEDGYYNPSKNATTCLKCKPGTISSTDRTNCICCSNGKECSNNIENDCPDGTYSLGCSEHCEICPIGFYCDEKGEIPKPCPIGYYSGYGSMSCEICPNGYFCSQISSSPKKCEYGYYTSNGFCQQCPAGKECVSGSATECPDGTYSRKGDGFCTRCPAGHHCKDKVQAVPCPENYYSLGGMLDCIECEAGKACLSTSQSSIDCEDGQFSLLGEKYCTKCNPGEKCTSKTSNSNDYCNDGQFSELGRSECKDCPKGFYCPDSKGYAPITCPKGYYSSIEGSAKCIICPKGSFCEDPTIDPTTPTSLCVSGTYSVDGQTKCYNCPLNHECSTDSLPAPCAVGSSNPERSTTTCTVCDDGLICDGSGDFLDEICPLGSFCENGVASDCLEGYYGVRRGEVDNDNACEKCTPGYYCPTTGMSAISKETKCPRGSYCIIGEDAPILCDAGTYNPKTGSITKSDCNLCPAGYYCPAGSANYELNPCTQSHYCPAGSANPTECPIGTYNTYIGKENVTDCIQCPAGYYCEQPASVPTACNPGFFNPNVGSGLPSNCIPCRAGKMCPDSAMITDELFDCTKGYYCLEGTSNSPDLCPDGTFSNKTGLRRKEDCEICWEGFACSETNGMIICDPGHYCPGAPRDGSSKIFTLETYSGKYAVNPDDFKCPNGTYNPNYGLKNESECIICPAGYYCEEASISTTGDCVIGYYCPEGSYVEDQIPCPDGTFNNETNKESVDGCYDCPKGSYCESADTDHTLCPEGSYGNVTNKSKVGPSRIDALSCTLCPAGFYCVEGSVEPVLCGIGKYSEEGKASCETCEKGKYCPLNDTTHWRMLFDFICDEGLWCDVGVDEIPNLYTHPCPAGFYCPRGTDTIVACPPGTFNPTLGRGDVEDCEICPKGYYCELNSTTPIICSSGSYCPKGSYQDKQVLCPERTYRKIPGGDSIESCSLCPNGYYCLNGTSDPEICPEGYYCIHGTSQPEPCPIGTFSNVTGVNHVDLCTLCPPGKYCDGIGLTTYSGLCSAGHYCKEGAITKAPQGDYTGGGCPRGGYCLEGSVLPEPCPPGTFNNFTGGKSSSDCSSCLPGYFCLGSNQPEPTDFCRGGYYCDGGSDVPEQHSVGSGYFSNDGSYFPIPCPPGTYTDVDEQSECFSCPPGDYCPSEKTTTPEPCPIGHYCLKNSITPEKCPPGTFTNSTERRNVSQCLPCPVGKYCYEYGLSEETGDCYEGYYCNGGSNRPDKIICPTGYYCEAGDSPTKCPDGTYNSNEGGKSIDDCYPCLAGKYCDSTNGGRSTPNGDCDENFYCTLNSDSPTKYPCTKGHKCEQGSVSPVPCDVGEYQTLTQQSTCNICTKSKYCNGTTIDPENCKKGYYCPEGTGFDLVPCPPGSYSNLESRENITQCNLCDAGKFCSEYSLTAPNGDCLEGYFCESGSIDEYGNTGILGGNGGICPKGYYCETGTSIPDSCPKGTFSNQEGLKNESQCSLCTPGYYCDELNLNIPFKKCRKGYYCSLGSETDNPMNCTAGSYCPEGSAYPILCPNGYYSSEDGNYECELCVEGKYCEEGTITPQTCEKGYFCPNGTGRLNIEDHGCEVGTFSNQMGLVNSTQCDLCLGGKICSTRGLTENDDECPPGIVCYDGVKNYIGEVSFKGGSSEVCPLGSYCTKSSSTPSLCGIGKYSNKIGMIESDDCIDCTPGYYCDQNGLSSPVGKCEEKYFCKIGATSKNISGNICPKGNYCPEGTVYPIECEEGTYTNSTGSVECLDCPESYYCDEKGMQIPKECIEGFYCPIGAKYPIPCPKGSYGNIVGATSIDNCTLCDIGRFCSQRGLTEPDGFCNEGYYCISGAKDNNGNLGILGGNSKLCEKGMYCGLGTTTPNLCPDGTFNPQTGRFNESHCLICSKGKYCDSQGLEVETNVCDGGFYCPEGETKSNNTMYKCEPGYYCPEGSTEMIGCEDGFYQDEFQKETCKSCPSGSYCNKNSSSPLDCPVTFYCPKETGFPIKCPPGTYGDQNSTISSSFCKYCTEGKYCTHGEITGNCFAGYYCKQKNAVPNPVGDPLYGDLCPQGYYCFEQTTSATINKCPDGTFSTGKGGRSIYDCQPCPEGYFCESGTHIAHPCPKGSYCMTMKDPELCEMGTYNPVEKATNESYCIPCDEGKLCDQKGLKEPNKGCPMGSFCPSGNIFDIKCPKGTYNLQKNQTSIDDCLVCPEKYYCQDEGTIFYEECPSGFYCPEGTVSPNGCPASKYCPGNTSVPIECPPGFYCPYKSVSPIKCVGAFYCEGNNSVPISCPFGYYFYAGNHTRDSFNSSCKICPKGTFMNNTVKDIEVCEPCEKGFICLEGSKTGKPTNDSYGYICPKGHYCLQGSKVEIACDVGEYQNEEGKTSCKKCPEGYYSNFFGSIYCISCGPNAVHNDIDVNGTLKRMGCLCKGANRYFQYSDGSCFCHTGYGYFNDYQLMDIGDGIEDCVALTKDRCNDENRNIKGDCVNEVDEFCSKSCKPEQTGKFVLGVCVCSPSINILSECNETCIMNQVQIKFIDNEIVLYNPENQTIISTYKQNKINSGNLDCIHGACNISLIQSSNKGFSGLYGAKASFIDNILNSDTGSSFSSNRRAIKNVDYSTSVEQPLVCLIQGNALMWDLSSSENLHFPVYEKDSILNSNPGFDYGDFRKLKQKVLSNSSLNSFVFFFNEIGIYTFSDYSTPEKIMIVKVVDRENDTEISSCVYPYLPINTTNLEVFSIFETNQIFLSPTWTMVGFLFISGSIAGMMIIIVYHYISTQAWKREDIFFNKLIYSDEMIKELVNKNINNDIEKGKLNLAEDIDDFNVKIFFSDMDDYSLKVERELGTYKKIFDKKYENILYESTIIKEILSGHLQDKICKIIDVKKHMKSIVNLKNDRKYNDLIQELRNKMINVSVISKKNSNVSTDFFTQRRISSFQKRGKKIGSETENLYKMIIDKIDNINIRKKISPDQKKIEIESLIQKHFFKIKTNLEGLNEVSIKITKLQYGSKNLIIPGYLSKYFKVKLDEFLSEILEKDQIDDKIDISENDLNEIEDNENDDREKMLEKKLKRMKKNILEDNFNKMNQVDNEIQQEEEENKKLINDLFKKTEKEHIQNIRSLLTKRLKNTENLTDEEIRKLIKNSKDEMKNFQDKINEEKEKQKERLKKLLEEKRKKRLELLKNQTQKKLQRHKEESIFSKKQFKLLEDELKKGKNIDSIKQVLQMKIKDRKEFFSDKKVNELDDLEENNEKEIDLQNNFEKQKQNMLKNTIKTLKEESENRILDTSVNDNEKKMMMNEFENNMKRINNAINTEFEAEKRKLAERIKKLNEKKKRELQALHTNEDEIEINEKVKDLKYIKQHLSDSNDEDQRRKDFIEEKEKKQGKEKQKELERIDLKMKIKKEQTDKETEKELEKLEKEKQEKIEKIENEIRGKLQDDLEIKKAQMNSFLTEQTDENDKDKIIQDFNYSIQKYKDEKENQRQKQVEEINKKIEERKRLLKEKMKKRMMEEQKKHLLEQVKIIDAENEKEKEKEEKEKDKKDKKIEEKIIKRTKSQIKIEKKLEFQKKKDLQNLEKKLELEEEKKLEELKKKTQQELEEAKKKLEEENKKRLELLQKKMKSGLESRTEEDSVLIKKNFEEERKMLKEKTQEELSKHQKLIEQKLLARKLKLKKEKEKKLKERKKLNEEEVKSLKFKNQLKEEKNRILKLLEDPNSKKQSVREVVYSVIKPRQKKEYNEMIKSNENKSEIEKCKNKVDLKKRHLKEEMELISTIEKMREVSFEDEELKEFEEVVKREQDKVLKKIEEQKRIQQEIVETRIAEEELKISKELERLKKEANEKQKLAYSEILKEKEKTHKLKASTMKEQMIEQHIIEIQRFENALEKERERQNRILLEKIKILKQEQLKKKQIFKLDQDKNEIKKKLLFLSEAQMTPRTSKMINERTRFVFDEFEKIPKSKVKKLKFGPLEIIQPEKLSKYEQRLYGFSSFIIDLINKSSIAKKRKEKREMQKVKKKKEEEEEEEEEEIKEEKFIKFVNVASTIPKTYYKNNVFQYYVYYEEQTKSLNIRKELFEKNRNSNNIGIFIMILIHSIAHIKVNDFDDTNNQFMKQFIQFIIFVNNHMYNQNI